MISYSKYQRILFKLLTRDSSQAVKQNVIKQATKQHKQHLTLKAEDIKADNIQTTKRDRVANKQLNDFVINIKQTTQKQML